MKLHMQSIHPHRQMSEAFITAAFLLMSGGLQDAYTYINRGQVFANGQTGNVVLFSMHLIEGDWLQALRYLIPISAYAMGIVAAEQIHSRITGGRLIHWRQVVVLVEITLLAIVGFIPHELDMLANAMVSLSCAMQVEAFRKVTGHAYASTMCVGNMRSGMEALYKGIHNKDDKLLRKGIRYWQVIGMFAVGAGVGSFFIIRIGAHAIWGSCILLAISFCLMLIREEEELTDHAHLE